MTSTDIVKWRKNEWLWKFWKRNDFLNVLKKGGGVVEKREEGETKSMLHAAVCCAYEEMYIHVDLYNTINIYD